MTYFYPLCVGFVLGMMLGNLIHGERADKWRDRYLDSIKQTDDALKACDEWQKVSKEWQRAAESAIGTAETQEKIILEQRDIIQAK